MGIMAGMGIMIRVGTDRVMATAIGVKSGQRKIYRINRSWGLMECSYCFVCPVPSAIRDPSSPTIPVFA